MSSVSCGDEYDPVCPVSLYRIVRGYVEHTFIGQDLTFGLLSDVWTRGALILGARSPLQLNFVWWNLIFVGA
jgi:hypothetical protein